MCGLAITVTLFDNYCTFLRISTCKWVQASSELFTIESFLFLWWQRWRYDAKVSYLTTTTTKKSWSLTQKRAYFQHWAKGITFPSQNTPGEEVKQNTAQVSYQGVCRTADCLWKQRTSLSGNIFPLKKWEKKHTNLCDKSPKNIDLLTELQYIYFCSIFPQRSWKWKSRMLEFFSNGEVLIYFLLFFFAKMLLAKEAPKLCN